MPTIVKGSMTLKGQKQAARAISKAKKQIHTSHLKVLNTMVRTFSNFCTIYAPVDTGALRRSWREGDSNNVKRQIERYAIAFGSSLPYAARQEYMDHYNHPKGGQAHYGERSIMETKAFMKKKALEIYKRNLSRTVVV